MVKVNFNFCLHSFSCLGYAFITAPYRAVGFSSLNNIAGSRDISDMRYFCARKPIHTRIMAGRDGGAYALAGSYVASLLTPSRLATPFSSVVARLLILNIGAANMANHAIHLRLYLRLRLSQSPRCHQNSDTLKPSAFVPEGIRHTPHQRPKSNPKPKPNPNPNLKPDYVLLFAGAGVGAGRISLPVQHSGRA